MQLKGGDAVNVSNSALVSAALAFAGATALGSAVAIHDDLPGEPLGISVPMSVPVGLLAGWGAGVAAPWPMPVAALMAATAARGQGCGPCPGAVCAVLGIGCFIGTLVEPVTGRPGSWSPMTRLAISMNLAASTALVAAGLRHSAAARTQRRQG